MKIIGTGPIRSATETARLRKKGASSDARFAEHVDDGTHEASSRVSGTAKVTAVDALLALQEVPDATGRRAPGVRRAEDLLDRLEDIRLGLLQGSIPRDRLGQLLDTVRSQREQVEDPRLNVLLDEIELRAAVELAKLEQWA